MVITTMLAYVVARRLWGWGALQAGALMSFFLVIDLAFFGANALKIADGGWFPLTVGGIVFTLMTTWKRGREVLSDRLRPGTLPMDLFLASISHHPPVRVNGTAVFMVGNPEGVPHALLHNLKHNKVLHQRVVFLTITTIDVPRVKEEERLEVIRVDETFYRILARYGFMEDPNVPNLLERCKQLGLEFNMMETTFFLGRETLIPTKTRPGMALWREKLFVWMSRNARSATDFFRLPPNRVVELGAQIEL
jgi:KUP system potassium uptake protein